MEKSESFIRWWETQCLQERADCSITWIKCRHRHYYEDWAETVPSWLKTCPKSCIEWYERTYVFQWSEVEYFYFECRFRKVSPNWKTDYKPTGSFWKRIEIRSGWYQEDERRECRSRIIFTEAVTIFFSFIGGIKVFFSIFLPLSTILQVGSYR